MKKYLRFDKKSFRNIQNFKCLVVCQAYNLIIDLNCLIKELKEPERNKCYIEHIIKERCDLVEFKEIIEEFVTEYEKNPEKAKKEFPKCNEFDYSQCKDILKLTNEFFSLLTQAERDEIQKEYQRLIDEKYNDDYFKPIITLEEFNIRDRIPNGPDLIYHAPVIHPSLYEQRHLKETMEKEWNKRNKEQ